MATRHADRSADGQPVQLTKKEYEGELERLQTELVHMQEWVRQSGTRLLLIFEGRDTAGKGGSIKRIMERLNPRFARIVALGVPTERRRRSGTSSATWRSLPAAGEIVMFDRSWYNRAGVEKVMGFVDQPQYEEFMHQCPIVERLLVDDGIILIKYWLSISDEEQRQRFQSASTTRPGAGSSARWTSKRSRAGSTTPRPRTRCSPSPTPRTARGGSSMPKTSGAPGST